MPRELEQNGAGEEAEEMGKITSENCARCHRAVSEFDDDTLECFSGCRETVHMRCLTGVNEDEWKVLKGIKNAMYVCDTCLALHGYDDRINIEKKIDVMITKLEELEKKMNFMENFDGKVRQLFKDELSKLCPLINVSGESSLNGTPRYNLRSSKSKSGMENTGQNVEKTPIIGSSKGSNVYYSDVAKENVEHRVNSSVDVMSAEENEWRTVNRRKVIRNAGKTPTIGMNADKSGAGTLCKNGVVNGSCETPESHPAKKRSDSNEPKKKPNPKVVIKPRNSEDVGKTKKVLSENVRACDVKVTDVITRRDGAIIVELNDETSCENFKQTVENAMGDKYIVDKSEPSKPLVKVLGISEELNKDELKKSLLDNNEILDNVKHLEIVKIYPSNGTFNAIIEVDARTYSKLMEQGKLICEWDRCRVVDGIDVIRCYKCCAFNHIAANCKAREITCPRCAGAHPVQECDSSVHKCANCIRMSKNGRQGVRVDHVAWSDRCPVYRRLKEKKKEKVDFGV